MLNKIAIVLIIALTIMLVFSGCVNNKSTLADEKLKDDVDQVSDLEDVTNDDVSTGLDDLSDTDQELEEFDTDLEELTDLENSLDQTTGLEDFS